MPLIPPSNPNNPNDPDSRKKTGTGFTNLNRIIQASQGNRLGQAVGGGVAQQAGQAKESLNQANTAFNQESEQNRLDTDQNKQAAQDTLNHAEQGQDLNEQDVGQYSRFRQGQYTGPQQLQNQDQVVNQANQAQNLGQLAQNAGGRQALLQRFVGGAGYSQGKQRLDNLLLGQSGSQDLRNARRDTQGLGQQAANSVIGAQQKAQYLSNQAQNFGQDVNNQYNSSVGLTQDKLNELLTNATTQQKTQLAHLQKGIQGQEELTDDELAQFGLDKNKALFNTDLSSFAQNSMIPTIANVADQQTAAKIGALSKLGGENVTEGQKNLFQSLAADPTQINQFNEKGAVSVDKDAVKNILLQRNNEFEEGMKDRNLSANLQGLGSFSNDIAGYASKQRDALQNIANANKMVPEAQQNYNNAVNAAMQLNGYNLEKAMNSPNVLAIKSKLDQLQNTISSQQSEAKKLQDDFNQRKSTDATFQDRINNQLKLIAAPDQAANQDANGFLNMLGNQDVSGEVLANPDVINKYNYFSNWYGDKNNAFNQREKSYNDYLTESGANQTIATRQEQFKKQQEEELKNAQIAALQQIKDRY